MRAPSPALAWGISALLLFCSAGCSKSGTATATARTGAAVAGNVVDVVRTAAAHEAPIAALNAAAHRQRGARSDLGAALRDRDVFVRRAATYVAALWADDAADVATLTPLLSDADPGVQAMVAGSLAGLGDGAARATLESLRTSTALMPWSEPPMTVGDFAASAIAAIDAVGRRQ